MDITGNNPRRHETMMIIRSYLQEQGLHDTAASLVAEEGTLAASVQKLQNMVLSGSLAEAEEYLNTFKYRTNGSTQWCTLLYSIRKQKVLESLNGGEIDDARLVLTHQLCPLRNAATWMSSDIETLLASFDKPVFSPPPSRQQLLKELQYIISSNRDLSLIFIPEEVQPARLQTLFEQSLKWQFRNCTDQSHDSVVATLLTDHECTPQPLDLEPIHSVPCVRRSGLQNPGNLCFLNASLQALRSCSPFVQLIQSIARKDIPKADFPTLAAFSDFIVQSNEQSSSSFTPRMFERVLKVFTPDTLNFDDRPRQEDAAEFLSFVINAMYEDLSRLRERTQTLFPSAIFNWVLEKGKEEESYLLIPLHIYEVSTIQKSLEVFFAPEVDPAGATKSKKLQKFSSIMMLHLLRFSFDRNNGISTKIDKVVQFPLELNLADYVHVSASNSKDLKYELVASITHHGSDPSMGHYTTNAREENGVWMRFDDAVVNEIETKAVLDGQAYVLFYQQVMDNVDQQGGDMQGFELMDAEDFGEVMGALEKDKNPEDSSNRRMTEDMMDTNLEGDKSVLDKLRENLSESLMTEDMMGINSEEINSRMKDFREVISNRRMTEDMMDTNLEGSEPLFDEVLRDSNVSLAEGFSRHNNVEDHSSVPILPPISQSLPIETARCIMCSDQINDIEFHPHLPVLLIGTKKGTIILHNLNIIRVKGIHMFKKCDFKIWKPEELSQPYKEIFAKLDNRTEGATCVAWGSLRNNTIYGVGFSEGLMHLYEYADNDRTKRHLEIEAHLGGVNSMVFYTLKGKLMLLTCGHDKFMRVWDSSRRSCLANYHHVESLISLDVHVPNQNELYLVVVVSDVEGNIMKLIIDGSGQTSCDYNYLPKKVAPIQATTEVKLSRDGKRLFTCIIGQPSLLELDIDTLDTIRVYEGVSNPINKGCMDVSNNSYIALLCGKEKCVRVWKVDTKEPFTNISEEEKAYQDSPILRFNREGSLLAVVFGRYVRILASPDGKKSMGYLS